MPVKLGELLLKENMVNPQQLQEALSHQKMNGGKLGKAFVSLGYVKDEEITLEPPEQLVGSAWNERIAALGRDFPAWRFPPGFADMG